MPLGNLVPDDMHPEHEQDEPKKIAAPSDKLLIGTASLVALLIVGGLFVSPSTQDLAQRSEAPQEIMEETPEEPENAAPQVVYENPFEGIDIEARAAVVWDVNERKIIYSQSEDAQLPLASLSKIMTALVASEELDQNSEIVIHGQDLLAEGNNGLFENERWKLADLIDFMLIVSSNDGSQAIATAIESVKNIDTPDEVQKTAFIDIMNSKARNLNLHQTYFLNPSGLDVDEVTLSGSYGSAKDITVLVDHILRTSPNLLEGTTEPEREFVSLSNFEHTAENTNIVINEIPGLIASKTGYTELAGGNLVIAFDAGLMQPYIITILGSSKEERFNDILKLREATIKYVTLSSTSGTTPAASITQ